MFRNPYADGLIVLVIVLLFFGPKRLPSLGRSLGQGLREFKDSITGGGGDEDAERPTIESGAGAGERIDSGAGAGERVESGQASGTGATHAGESR